MLNILIVDDEPLARRALRQLLARHSDVSVVAACADGVSAGEERHQYLFDNVVLTDNDLSYLCINTFKFGMKTLDDFELLLLFCA